MEEMIGHVESLDVEPAVDHWKAHGLDISPILAVPQNPYGQTLHQSVPQDHGLDEALDQELIRLAQPAIVDGTRSPSTCRSAT
jgi:glutamate synthase (NADPH) large chain